MVAPDSATARLHPGYGCFKLIAPTAPQGMAADYSRAFRLRSPDEAQRNPGYHRTMVHYRRSRVPGATFFFTVALRDRRADTLVRYVDFLRAAFRHERARRPFAIDAMVVLPDHLHSVWTLPAGDADYSGRWRAIKSGFVRRLRAQGLGLAANTKGEHTIWQRRFWEHQIRDEVDLARHVDYVHINPVKHGLVERVADWRWSTFHRYVRLGTLPADWATEAFVEGAFGE